jgi:hypothetical protein
VLQGPYRRRRRTLRQRVLQLGFAGWLWVFAALLAGVLIVLYVA